MTLEDLKKIQEVQREILFSIVAICEKYGIEYFLMYGTLLGAVRHGDTIPWDDDIDLGMKREHYLRFLELTRTAPEWDRRNEVHVMGSGTAEYMSELKIGRKGTCLAMPGTENLGVFMQVGVDVFLIDHIKEMSSFKYRVCDALRKIGKIVKLNWDEKKLLIYHINRSTRKGKSFFKAGLYAAHVVRTILGEKTIEKVLYHLFVDKTGTSGRLGTLTATKVGLWRAEGFRPTEMTYAGRSMSVAESWEELLKVEFGDYMELPPIDKRYRKNFEQYVFSYEEN